MILARPILHPALQRLWWRSVLGWFKRVALMAATPAGFAVTIGVAILSAAIFREGLRTPRPWIESVDPTGVVSMLAFALLLPAFVYVDLSSWTNPAEASLFHSPLPRRQIQAFLLLRRLAVTAFWSLPVAVLLDSYFYFDLAFRLASFGMMAVSGLMLANHLIARLSHRANLALDVLALVPVLFGLGSAAALAGLRFAGAEGLRATLLSFLLSLRLNEPFLHAMQWVSTPGWAGALMVSASFLTGTLVFSTLLLSFFEPSPELDRGKGLNRLLQREHQATPSRLPNIPRLGGMGPLLRVQVLGSYPTLTLQLLVYSAVAQLPMLVSSGAAQKAGPTSLSMVLFVASIYAIFSETALKRVLFDHMERFKSLPVDPFPLLAANLVGPIVGALTLAVVALVPSFLLFPTATLELPLGKFFFTLVPLVIFVTAAAQTIMLTIHQQFQRLSMAKRWYQEAAYLVSLLLAFFVSLFLLLLIVAPTIGWREDPWSSAVAVASIQLVGTALMFWYARLSYRLIEVLHHNE